MARTPGTRQRRQEGRRAAILKGASKVFFKAGYDGASIDAIIERIGGSKQTIYREFGSKEGLFAAIITENVSQALSSLAPEELSGHDLRSTLLNFGRRLMSTQMAPTTLALFRVVVAAGTRFPELARSFYDNGPHRVIARLAEVLTQYGDRREIRVADPWRDANIFVGMIRGNLQLEVVLGLRPPPGPEESETIVKAKVDIFLDGVRARR